MKSPIKDEYVLSRTATLIGYWESLDFESMGFSREKEKDYWKALKKDMSLNPVSQSTPDPIMEELLKDEIYLSSISNYKGLDYINGGTRIEIYVNSYPPYVQHCMNLYLETFNIDPFIIPNPDRNKGEFSLWVKGFENIKKIGGDILLSSLVRAKRNYDERHKKSFELDHPGTIFKILKSAKKELEEESENLVEMEVREKKELSDNTGLSSLRGIFE